MKIAIHHRQNSYSEHWIDYCQQHNIQYKIVNAYSNDILEQIAGCDIFMWHHHFHQYKDYLIAKQLIYTIQRTGIITYPNFDTCWHYDDKVAQKYLLESINAPTIPTYIFYSKQEALDWIKQATFPKVFKLRNGASSENVRLAKSKSQSKRFIRQAFSSGFVQYNRIYDIKEQWSKYRSGNGSFPELLRSIKRLFVSTEFSKLHPKEIGYVYFQDFLPNNDFDIRVFVIGKRAVAKKRMNRENDFRASGSKKPIYAKGQIDKKCIEIAFETSKRLQLQSAAFDFLYDNDRNPVITEISYCGGDISNNYCGYWTDNIQWHDSANINICDWIIEDVIEKAMKP